ncbi:hypothetical protein M9H77_17453 [Catharanthus roseus]|uniref:Uncharacterized protein n=1 Tax=Catharanthus roseus TaxID=4058 RepID=A0ACC0B4M5_CATRO|nr:hypothetical protein M9H77_17453 [Catharanthus roseus]
MVRRQGIALVEKSFNELVIDHFKLETLSWGSVVPLLCISGEYWPGLIREFYANMTHKMDKDLQIIISTIKGVRIILDKEHPASILGILDKGNTPWILTEKPSKRTRTGIRMQLVAVLISGHRQWIVTESSTGAISHPFFLVPFLISSGTHLFKKGADLVWHGLLQPTVHVVEAVKVFCWPQEFVQLSQKVVQWVAVRITMKIGLVLEGCLTTREILCHLESKDPKSQKSKDFMIAHATANFWMTWWHVLLLTLHCRHFVPYSHDSGCRSDDLHYHQNFQNY